MRVMWCLILYTCVTLQITRTCYIICYTFPFVYLFSPTIPYNLLIVLFLQLKSNSLYSNFPKTLGLGENLLKTFRQPQTTTTITTKTIAATASKKKKYKRKESLSSPHSMVHKLPPSVMNCLPHKSVYSHCGLSVNFRRCRERPKSKTIPGPPQLK